MGPLLHSNCPPWISGAGHARKLRQVTCVAVVLFSPLESGPYAAWRKWRPQERLCHELSLNESPPGGASLTMEEANTV